MVVLFEPAPAYKNYDPIVWQYVFRLHSSIRILNPLFVDLVAFPPLEVCNIHQIRLDTVSRLTLFSRTIHAQVHLDLEVRSNCRVMIPNILTFDNCLIPIDMRFLLWTINTIPTSLSRYALRHNHLTPAIHSFVSTQPRQKTTLQKNAQGYYFTVSRLIFVLFSRTHQHSGGATLRQPRS